jgi:type VI secretion system protein VasG
MPDAKRLVATLTPPARGALERAAERALREKHAAVELEHLLLELCRADDTELAFLLRNERIDPQPLQAALAAAVSRFPSGSPRIPALSFSLLDTLTAAWVIASIDHGLGRLSSAALVCAVREDPQRYAALLAAVPAFGAVFESRLLLNLPEWLRRGAESNGALAERPDTPAANSALDNYTIDLTELARAGRVDPVIGRDAEIRQIIDVLMRRQQNNPILTGPTGVGKTAIVEGFAAAIAEGRVPPRLANLVVRTLDLGLLQAGASIRGEFEQRLRVVVDEASATTPRTVLFIDEAHMLIGAGGPEGQGDAANLLKPALARGQLGVIAATTWSEYKRFIEKDSALARRFQVIRVAEPSERVATEMLRGLAPKLEGHHGVVILEEALTEAVRLSHRYINGRQLPEKALAALDTACAHVAIARSLPSAVLAEAEADCAALEAKLARMCRETTLKVDRVVRMDAIDDTLGTASDGHRAGAPAHRNGNSNRNPARFAHHNDTINGLGRTRPVRGLTGMLGNLRRVADRVLGSSTSNGHDSIAEPVFVLDMAHSVGFSQALAASENGCIDATRQSPELEAECTELHHETPHDTQRAERLAALELDLAEARHERDRLANGGAAPTDGDSPPNVDGQAIASVVAGWTGIPLGRMLTDSLADASSIKTRLAERIVDQDPALDVICRRIQTFYADLGEPNKPTGVFLLYGPSGVGKTETALALAELLFGGSSALITVNMSEYQEAHSVSGLRGAPPGYVGYGRGGALTEAVRRQPYCVLLLDEIEKAHRDVLELFYQVFDRGMLEDSEGQLVDFTNTLILLTSNIGADNLHKLVERDPSIDADALATALRPVLLRNFSPALLGRLVTVPYRPLGRAGIEAVTRLKLSRLQERFAATGRGELTYDADVAAAIAERAGATESGARMVDSILTHSVLPELSGRILDHLAEGRLISGAHLSLARNGAIVVSLIP